MKNVCNKSCAPVICNFVAFFAVLCAIFINTEHSLDNSKLTDVSINKADIARSFSKLFVNCVEEKYANELMINMARNDDNLKKIIDEVQKKRVKLVKDLEKSLISFGNNKEAIFYRNSISNINKKITKFLNESNAYLGGKNPDFKIPNWSNGINAVLDELEKLAELTTNNSHQKSLCAGYMASVIANCYRQIFLISMYAYESQSPDELGKLMFFTYEREIIKSWQKLQAIFWFNEDKNWFIKNFQHKYFDSFVSFRNAFLASKHSDPVKLFKEFRLIVSNYDQFFDDCYLSGFKLIKLSRSSFSVTIFNILAAFIILLATAIIITNRRNDKNKGTVTQNFDDPIVTDIVSGIRNTRVIKNEEAFINKVYDDIRDIAINNHKELNSIYCDVVRGIDTVRERINSIIDKNNKLQESVDVFSLKHKSDAVEMKFNLASDAITTLVNIGTKTSAISYSSLEDLSQDILDSLNKVDAVNTAISEICKRINTMFSEAEASTYDQSYNGHTMITNLKIINQIAAQKLSSIKQWNSEIKRSNEDVINTLKLFNNAIYTINSGVKGIVEKSSALKVANGFDNTVLEKNIDFIGRAINNCISCNAGSIESIVANLDLFRKDTVKLVNSMSAFKDTVLENIKSYNMQETDEDDTKVAKDRVKTPKYSDIKNKFYGSENSAAMSNNVVSMHSASKKTNEVA